MIFQNFSLENLMRFVGKTFNLNTIILENQSTSFYQFISIIFLFIYIEVSVSFIKSEGKIEISSIRQGRRQAIFSMQVTNTIRRPDSTI